MPFSLTYFGNVVLDASPDEEFGAEYKFEQRFSYYTQLILTKKFSDKLSLLLAPGFVHMNTADSIPMDSRFYDS